MSRALLLAVVRTGLVLGGAMGQCLIPAIDPLSAQQPADTANPPTAREGFLATSDGTRLYYRRLGEGVPTVIIPGDLFTFDGLGSLGRDLDVVFYDMRNRGRSDAVRDTATLTVHQDVLDLDEVRRYFAAPRVSVVGYSYLGLMVMLYAMEHADRVERVVQLGPVPLRFGTRYPPGMGTAAPAALPDSMPLFAARRMQESGEHLRNPREHCEHSWLVSRYGLVGDASTVQRLGPGLCHLPNEWPTNLARHFRFHFPSVQALMVPWDSVRAYTSPVLVIHGTTDRNAPYGAGREWAQNLPNARLLTIEGAAHRAWADAPDRVLDAIRLFLHGRWPEDAARVQR